MAYTMVSGKLPRDANFIVFPAATGANTFKVSFTNVATAVSLSGDCMHLKLYATQDCHVTIHATADADANDFLVPAGMVVDVPIAAATRLSVIQDSTAGDLYIWEFV